jgi:hypothetical protein
MLFELVILAGSCQNGACRIERPILERRLQKSVLVKVEKEVVKERRIRHFIRKSIH